jgi:hypothetical protein
MLASPFPRRQAKILRDAAKIRIVTHLALKGGGLGLGFFGQPRAGFTAGHPKGGSALQARSTTDR